MKLAALAIALSIASANAAISSSTPTEIDGINWTVSYDTGAAGAFPASCTSMASSAISTFKTGAPISATAVLSCGASGSYVGTGTGFLTTEGTYAFTMTVGVTNWICQVGLSTLSGACKINYNNGNNAGNVVLTFVQ